MPFSDAFFLMAIARGFKTPGKGGQPCLGSLNSVNTDFRCHCFKKNGASNQIRSDSGHPRDPEQDVVLHLHV